jgi:hypothetical protein
MQATIETYLEQFRRALEAQDVDSQQEALSDAREFLEAEFEECRRTRPDLEEAEAFELVCQRFGSVDAVARAYDHAEGPSAAKAFHRTSRRWSYAPGWKVSCTRCGRSADLGSVAPLTVRWMAWARLKFGLAWCSTCRRPTWIRYWKA